MFHYNFSIIMYEKKKMYLGKFKAYHQLFFVLCVMRNKLNISKIENLER